MATKKIGGIGRTYSWDDFSLATRSAIDVEDSDDSQHLEIYGSPGSYTASGTFTSGVIDLRGRASQIDFDTTEPGATSITISIRSSNTAPVYAIDGRNWSNLMFPSEVDAIWGKKFSEEAYIGSKAEIIDIRRTPWALSDISSIESFHVTTLRDNIGAIYYSTDGTTWTAFSSNLKAQLTALGFTAGDCNILQIAGCSTSGDGEAILIGESEFSGAFLIHARPSSSWDDMSLSFSVSGYNISRDAIIDNLIYPDNNNLMSVAQRYADKTGAIMNSWNNGVWTTNFLDDRIMIPINFASSLGSSNMYLSCLYQDEYGWKNAIFRGKISGSSITWSNVEYDGENETNLDRNLSCGGVCLVNVSGTYKAFALSTAGTIWDVEANLVVDTCEDLGRGRIESSADKKDVIIYSTGNSGNYFLMKSPYKFAIPGPTYISDGITYCSRIIDIRSTEPASRNWNMVGSLANTEYGDRLISQSERLEYAEVSSGDPISDFRFNQIKAVLAGA